MSQKKLAIAWFVSATLALVAVVIGLLPPNGQIKTTPLAMVGLFGLLGLEHLRRAKRVAPPAPPPTEPVDPS